MAQVQKVRADENIGVINEILERDGCIVIENVLDKTQLDSLKSELRPHFEETPNCTGDFYGHATKRLSSLIAKSTLCQQMTIHPVILAAMDEFLLKGCRQYQINLTQAIQIGPGEPQQIMHPDDPLFPFVHPGYEAMINCMWAVDEFTTENGATNVVPGSHKWERVGLIPERVPQPDEITQGVMPAGSVLIYFGSLPALRRREQNLEASHRDRPQLLPGLAAPVGKPVSRRAASNRENAARKTAAPAGIFRARAQSWPDRGARSIELLQGKESSMPGLRNSCRPSCSRCWISTRRG